MRMLSGTKLGEALTAAMKLKGVGPTEVGKHFGIKAPSVKDWEKKGCIHKRHLGRLVAYFSDVVPPSHWGVEQLEMQTLASSWAPTDSNFAHLASDRDAAYEGSSLTFNVPDSTSSVSAPVVAWAELEAVLMKPNREWPGEAFIQSVALTPRTSDRTKFATVIESKLPNIAPGDIVGIDPVAEPTDGCVVLARTPRGRLELYRFRELADGGWEAFVPGEPPLDSKRHALTRLGVVVSLVKGTI